jgi:hypothetical protein
MVSIRKNKDFAFEVSLIANGEEYYDFKQDTNTDDYAPFKNIQVLNTGAADLKMYINGQNGYKLIPAGTILDRQDLSIEYLRIVNASSSLAANFTFQLDNDMSEKELLKALVLGKEELMR